MHRGMIAGAVGLGLLMMAGGLPLTSQPLAWAQQKAQKAQKTQQKARPAAGQATDITADNMEIDDARNIIVFSGNVRVRRGDTLLTAKRLEVLREKAASGKDGQQEGGAAKLRRWVATGGVRIVRGDTVITGSRAVMEVQTDTLTVTGNVVVKQPDSTIRGSKLITNLKTNVTRIVAGGKARVRGTFR